jgi:hypothetical protein
MLWSDLQTIDIEYAAGRTGTTKFSIYEGRPLRFQIPKGRVLYNGLSEFKSITIDMPPEFTHWWRNVFETAVASGLEPFNSNVYRDGSFRVKVDKSTQIFSPERQIQFPELNEGLFRNENVTCIIEVVGTYFFKETFGLTCRAHQILIAATQNAVEN